MFRIIKRKQHLGAAAAENAPGSLKSQIPAFYTPPKRTNFLMFPCVLCLASFAWGGINTIGLSQPATNLLWQSAGFFWTGACVYLGLLIFTMHTLAFPKYWKFSLLNGVWALNGMGQAFITYLLVSGGAWFYAFLSLGSTIVQLFAARITVVEIETIRRIERHRKAAAKASAS
jgi:hypothetical protein